MTIKLWLRTDEADLHLGSFGMVPLPYPLIAGCGRRF